MRRFYNVPEFMNMVDKIKGRYPGFNLTTDIIVGFPGDTQEDFQKTCEIAREAGFGHIHTFKYSIRQGTRAERMPDQITEKVKNERSMIIRSISEENKRIYRAGLIGKEQTVLVEKYNPRTHVARGYGEHYVPVEFKSHQDVHNQFVKVRLKNLSPGNDPSLVGSFKF
jgi:threonylcarbamoyladenosine tRNA methylthiotransferase MtaB